MLSIGLWVFAEIDYPAVSKTAALGSTAGRALDLSNLPYIEVFQAINLWVACAIGCGPLIGVYALMRSRLGLALLSARDNELAAGSIGIDVSAGGVRLRQRAGRCRVLHGHDARCARCGVRHQLVS